MPHWSVPNWLRQLSEHIQSVVLALQSQYLILVLNWIYTEPWIAGQFSFGTHGCYASSKLAWHNCAWLHASVPKEIYPVIHAQPLPVSFLNLDARRWKCLRLDLVYIGRHGMAYAPRTGTIPEELILSACRWSLSIRFPLECARGMVLLSA
jgi:hypothetical protein